MFTGGSLILTEKTTQANISYDKDGYDKSCYDKSCYDKDGYDKDGYNKDGYDKYGYLKRYNFGYTKSNDKTFYNYYLYF